MPGNAPLSSRSSAFFAPQRSLMTTVLPPIGFALPCRMFATVRPPARSRCMDRSAGLSTSPMPVIELTAVAPSLMASLAMCECASMMPGDTNLPVPSTTCASGRDLDVRPDRRNLAVAQDDGAVLNRAAGGGDDGRVPDRDHAWRRRRPGLTGLASDAGGQDRPRRQHGGRQCREGDEAKTQGSTNQCEPPEGTSGKTVTYRQELRPTAGQCCGAIDARDVRVVRDGES